MAGSHEGSNKDGNGDLPDGREGGIPDLSDEGEGRDGDGTSADEVEERGGIPDLSDEGEGKDSDGTSADEVEERGGIPDLEDEDEGGDGDLADGGEDEGREDSRSEINSEMSDGFNSISSVLIHLGQSFNGRKSFSILILPSPTNNRDVRDRRRRPCTAKKLTVSKTSPPWNTAVSASVWLLPSLELVRSCPDVTKGWLPRPETTLLPLFWTTVLDGAPLRPTRKGRLLLFTTPLTVLSGTPPLMGKNWLFFENGRLLVSELATIPATALPDGFEPPRMSCMEKGKCRSIAGNFTGAGTGNSSGGGGGVAATLVAGEAVVSGGASESPTSGTGAMTGAGSSETGATTSLVAGEVVVSGGASKLGIDVTAALVAEATCRLRLCGGDVPLRGRYRVG
ncbi:hypothetical protein SASPL_136919 [Salvia splendens]|uniref:Uncharacterized protein n=1 Tax=Salvia splendens TaxID=180675 RepID=A0A8X8ZH58_SALSN|nr:hypothetical protein SASPL_136919 [Salvia splendens]